MSERDDDHFDLDEEFLDGAAEEDHDYDRIIDRVDRGTKPKAGVKKGRAAWSKLEDVLAERRLKRETHEIDIANSQPLFLAKIIADSESKWVNSDELDLFRDLTINGNYYQHVMDHMKTKDRPMVKEMTYKVLFGRNVHNSKADKIFRELFPTIHNFIRLYKKEKGDYKVLAYELQKAESNLIFNKIIREVKNSFPEIKIVTVHDSIIIPRNRRDEVEAIFKTKLYEEFRLF